MRRRLPVPARPRRPVFVVRGALPAFIALIALVALAGPGCTPQTPTGSERALPAMPPEIGRQADCRPDFEDRDGWSGGDVAASVPLPDSDGRRSLWLFGDSFVSAPGEATGRRYPFSHNAIAVSRCDADGRWSMDFATRSATAIGRASDLPPAYFEPDPSAHWVEQLRLESGEWPYYWPISGATVAGTTFVALLRIAAAPAHGPFGLPFRPVGVDLARLERTDGPPETWQVRYSTLSSRSDLLPAASLVASRGQLYAFATIDLGDGRSPRALTRLPVSALEHWQSDLEPLLEVFGRDGTWRSGADPTSARLLMTDDASEMSVHFDARIGEWLAVYVDPTLEAEPPIEAEADRVAQPARADAIRLRRASRIEGPWSAPIVLARIPELAGGDDPLPGEPFCYAGKAHPELAHGGRLLVTYVCNFWSARKGELGAVLERLRTSPAFYRPRVLRLRVPDASGQT